MEFKVQKIAEPVSAQDKTKYLIDYPSDDAGWLCRFTENERETLKKKLTKKIEDGKEWIHVLYSEIWDKMKFRKPKLQAFKCELLGPTEEVLIAFANQLKIDMGLDKVKQKQKKINS